MARISAGERLLANVATEVVGFELGRSSSGDAAATAELRAFLGALPGAGPPSLGGLDVVLLARATLAVKDGDWATAVGILTAPGAAGCFPTLASERSLLMQVWQRARFGSRGRA